MGLFIIAGVLVVVGILFWILDKTHGEDWMFMVKLICLPVGCAMLLILLLIMGTNRADQNIVDMEKNYIIYTLALESCDSVNEYMVVANEINTYNDTVEQHRKMHKNEMTNWLFSPEIAEMPLIVVPDFKLKEAE